MGRASGDDWVECGGVSVPTSALMQRPTAKNRPNRPGVTACFQVDEARIDDYLAAHVLQKVSTKVRTKGCRLTNAIQSSTCTVAILGRGAPVTTLYREAPKFLLGSPHRAALPGRVRSRLTFFSIAFRTHVTIRATSTIPYAHLDQTRTFSPKQTARTPARAFILVRLFCRDILVVFRIW